MWKIPKNSLILLASISFMLAVVCGSQAIEMTATLRYYARQHGILIGAAVAINALRNEPIYRQVLAREFNSVTPENVMKFDAIQPERQRYNFTDGDEIVNFAKTHNMQVRGHTLVWHRSLPKWLEEGRFSREELKQILRSHIYQVVGHYRGKVFAWDVVNEAIAGNGSLRDTIWLKGIGPEYIDLAFRWAHEADPKAKLFYNDYGGEGLSQKSDAIYNFIQAMIQRGVPVNGIGLQMHIGLNNPPTPEAVSANIKRIAELGLDVHISEMDVKIQDGNGTEAERFAAQAKIYQNMLGVCLANRNCQAFILWGFTDKHSWIPWETKRPDAALIFDKLYRPKPAYNALIRQLSIGNR